MALAMAALPQELHDAIVDYCHDDRPTLWMCSRVCRAWLPASRYHIFSRVLLHPHNITLFLQLIRSPLCTIRPYVTHLAVEQGPNRYGGDQLWFNDSIPCLSGFTSVRFLHLLGLGLYSGDISDGLMATLRNDYHAVTNLEINQGVFRSFTQFANVIAAFPNIEHLALETIVWQDRTLPPPVQQCPLPHLKSLIFKSSYMTDVLSWLLSHELLPPINTTHLDYIIWPDDPVTVNTFFNRLGPTLEHLHLNDASMYDLSRNTRLQSIYIHYHLFPASVRGDWITSLISTITSPKMESIALRVFFFQSTDIEMLNWSSLEDSFSQPQFADLQQIEVCLPWSPFHQSIISTIRSRLPSCEARGLIRFSNLTTPPTPFADYLHPIAMTPSMARYSLRRTVWSRLRRWSCTRNPFF